ncbi:unnamed protein product [Vicia faba]|uniref:Secreted protein n=1 Tax=Vicia faba TaxID=3906 RepID=A0AAV0ZEC7_VICFA|nr:unnamed protein product [Vicia faba]
MRTLMAILLYRWHLSLWVQFSYYCCCSQQTPKALDKISIHLTTKLYQIYVEKFIIKDSRFVKIQNGSKTCIKNDNKTKSTTSMKSWPKFLRVFWKKYINNKYLILEQKYALFSNWLSHIICSRGKDSI